MSLFHWKVFRYSCELLKLLLVYLTFHTPETYFWPIPETLVMWIVMCICHTWWFCVIPLLICALTSSALSVCLTLRKIFQLTHQAPALKSLSRPWGLSDTELGAGCVCECVCLQVYLPLADVCVNDSGLFWPGEVGTKWYISIFPFMDHAFGVKS